MTSVPSDKTTPARFRPGWPVSILTLLALTVLIGLGTWQVQRLAWKNNLIETIQARSSADPIAMPEHPEAPEFNHRAVALTGYWLAATEQFVPAKTHNRELGEWLLQVLALDDGRMVLVNRGWVPLCMSMNCMILFIIIISGSVGVDEFNFLDIDNRKPCFTNYSLRK